MSDSVAGAGISNNTPNELPLPIGTVTSTGLPSSQQLIYVVIMAVLAILGAFGISAGVLKDSQTVWAFAGGVSTLVSVGGLVWQQYKLAHQDHINSETSARMAMRSGKPRALKAPSSSIAT